MTSSSTLSACSLGIFRVAAQNLCGRNQIGSVFAASTTKTSRFLVGLAGEWPYGMAQIINDAPAPAEFSSQQVRHYTIHQIKRAPAPKPKMKPAANMTNTATPLTPCSARFLEIVHDPTIGEACLKFDHILRRLRGMYLSITRKGHVKEVLRNWPVKDVRFICVTDAGRILGLGDLGANGMGIPIGKLQLYTAAAGVPPQGLLPMYLDAGTNNEEYLKDPLYVGLRQHRPPTEQLYAFVDEFVDAVREVFPNCCIHFEDWTGADAVELLARYRNKVCCYNDDIQGTAGVTLAGLINALKITGGQLKDQRILFLGAGSAAIGLADLIVSALVQQGVPQDIARQQIRMFDTHGLVVAGRSGLAKHKLPYAHRLPPSRPFNHLDLASEQPQIVAAIEDFKPTILIGVSTVGKLFSQEIVEAMSRLNSRPIIFALSNPIDKHECLPQDAYAWSQGKVV